MATNDSRKGLCSGDAHVAQGLAPIDAAEFSNGHGAFKGLKAKLYRDDVSRMEVFFTARSDARKRRHRNDYSLSVQDNKRICPKLGQLEDTAVPFGHVFLFY